MTDLPGPLVVVGAGRLGLVMAEAVRDAGIPLLGVVARSDAARTRCTARGLAVRADATGAAAVVLCVPDDAVAAAASALPPSVQVVMHTSGCVGLGALAEASVHGAAVGSVHPLMTFTAQDRGSRLAGVPMAITTGDARAHAAGLALVHAVRGIPFDLDGASKPLYHAGASLAANATVALLDAAIACAVAAGMPVAMARNALADLTAAAVDRVRELGPDDALTGPVARGDAGTVRAHRTMLAARAPEHLPLYDATARAVLALVRRRARADDATTTVRAALDEEATP